MLRGRLECSERHRLQTTKVFYERKNTHINACWIIRVESLLLLSDEKSRSRYIDGYTPQLYLSSSSVASYASKKKLDFLASFSQMNAAGIRTILFRVLS